MTNYDDTHRAQGELSTEDVARILSVGSRAVRRYITQGSLKARRLQGVPGNPYVVDTADLDAFRATRAKQLGRVRVVDRQDFEADRARALADADTTRGHVEQATLRLDALEARALTIEKALARLTSLVNHVAILSMNVGDLEKVVNQMNDTLSDLKEQPRGLWGRRS